MLYRYELVRGEFKYLEELVSRTGILDNFFTAAQAGQLGRVMRIHSPKTCHKKLFEIKFTV